jgi:hypothetical protein
MRRNIIGNMMGTEEFSKIPSSHTPHVGIRLFWGWGGLVMTQKEDDEPMYMDG